MSPRIIHERDADGRLIERVRGDGPRVKVKQISPDRSDTHRELKGEREIIETYDAEQVREWTEGLGREEERGKIDGTITYDANTPRRSNFAEALREAEITAADLGERCGVVGARLERHLIEETIPDPADREAVEAVPGFEDAFPVVVSTPAEQIGGQGAPTNTEAGAAAEAAAAERSKRRDRFAAERAEAIQRRQREVNIRRAELDSGLSKVKAKLDRIVERL